MIKPGLSPKTKGKSTQKRPGLKKTVKTPGPEFEYQVSSWCQRETLTVSELVRPHPPQGQGTGWRLIGVIPDHRRPGWTIGYWERPI